MNISNAQYIKDIASINTCVQATIDDIEMSVPLDPNNRHYAEIMRQVKEEGLTIKDAE